MSEEMKKRPASEIAAEIVPEPAMFGERWCTVAYRPERPGLLLTSWWAESEAIHDRDLARASVRKRIEQARCEGAVEALREVASRLDPLAREARDVSGSYHEHGDSEGAALEEGKASAYHHAAHVARELAARPRTETGSNR